MPLFVGARGGLGRLFILGAGLALLAALLPTRIASAQSTLIRRSDGTYYCSDAPPCLDGGPTTMCEDGALTCEMFPTSGAARPQYFCVDPVNDVLCCDSLPSCVGGNRCVGGYGSIRGIALNLCVSEEQVCDGLGASPGLRDDCWSILNDAGDRMYVERYGEGDCDGDRVINSMDDCDCHPAPLTVDGCPPVDMPDASTDASTDAGTDDAGPNADGAVGDAAQNTDGAVFDSGGLTPDGAVEIDTGNTDGMSFRGEGGCRCSTTEREDLGGGAVLATLVALFLFRRRS